MRAAKDELRREMRERRASVPAARARQAADRAAQHLAALPQFSAAQRVALYAPVRGELDTFPVARLLRSRWATVLYPCMAPSHRILAFHAVPDESHLVPNALGIPEPTGHMQVVDPADIDVIVVPGLAFDERGNRLGWGRAYYDTTLRAAPRALRVGYAYEFQIVPAVPATADDERVDVVVTDTGARPTFARPHETLRRVR